MVSSPAGKLKPTSSMSMLLGSFLGGFPTSLLNFSLALALSLAHLGIYSREALDVVGVWSRCAWRLLVEFLSDRLPLFLVFAATGDWSPMRSKTDTVRFPSLSWRDKLSWAEVLSVLVFPILLFKGARLDFSSGSNPSLLCGVRWTTL